MNFVQRDQELLPLHCLHLFTRKGVQVTSFTTFLQILPHLSINFALLLQYFYKKKTFLERNVKQKENKDCI